MSCDAYSFAGEPETGLPLGQEAVERARQLGDDVLLGESLMEYLLCSDLIDPARYRQLFAEAIACTRRSGDQLISRYLYNNAGVQALQAGDIPAARAHLDAAAQAMQAIGENSATVSVNLGWVLRQEGDPDGARSMFGAGLRTARRNGDRAGIAYAILGLACLAADRGDWHQAADAARRRAGLSRPGRRTMGGTRGALSPGKPRPTCGRASAMTRPTGPTPRAWRSASTGPLTWPVHS